MNIGVKKGYLDNKYYELFYIYHVTEIVSRNYINIGVKKGYLITSIMKIKDMECVLECLIMC
jgi:hypothetical protein